MTDRIAQEENDIVIRHNEIEANADPTAHSTLVITLADIDAISMNGMPALLVVHHEELTEPLCDESIPTSPLVIIVSDEDRCVLEQHMLDLINADRAVHAEECDARPLAWDVRVARVARAHSEDMIAQGYMNHINRTGLSPADRLTQAGIVYIACGENLAGSPTMVVHETSTATTHVTTGYSTIELAEEGLMNSPEHRRNILSRIFTHVGVGIAYNRDGTLVITQKFVA